MSANIFIGMLTYNRGLKPAVLGHDVWVGTYAVILAGVKIGEGSVIAASAVVTEDVEPFTVVGGVPAKVIGKRVGDRSFVEAIAQTDDLQDLEALAEKARRRSDGFRHE